MGQTPGGRSSIDVARLDHFRGYVAYWAVPEESTTALDGTWRRGPGRDLFDAVSAELGELPAIAEDLGVITPAVERLRDRLGLPGTVVTQFILDWHKSPIHVAELRLHGDDTDPRSGGGSRRTTTSATTRGTSPPREVHDEGRAGS